MTDPRYFVDIQLRWGDMDAFGHINNVEYVRLLEQARVVGLTDWFAGTDVDLLRTGVLVARQEIEYLAQLAYRSAPIRITMWVSRISGGSFDIGYEVRDPADVGEQLYARAETTMVCYDLVEGRSRRLSEGERGAFERMRGPEVPFRRRQR
ncbi:MAG: acyl-CoA thioesterase [Austwickia sp.]|nr:MAG: acyl-CoA thioesterase [Austwickia sp.]